MKIRCKFTVLSFILMAAILLAPVQSIFADDTSGSTNDRYDGPPYVNSSEVKFKHHQFLNWFGFADIPDENCIEEFILAHRKSSNTDYSNYNLVCDFELKTMGDSGYTTSNYTYKIDMESYEKGFFDELLVRFNLKEDYFEHAFDYFGIVRNAQGFQEKDITGKEKFYTYNTVISKADFYFQDKTTGEIGRVRRYKFSWNSNFWLQKCTKIEFSWYAQEEDYEKPIDSVENLNGVDGMNNDYTLDSKDDGISQFFLSIPSMLIRFLRGLFNFLINLPHLLSAVFPFFPHEFFVFLCTFILLIVVCYFFSLFRGIF